MDTESRIKKLLSAPSEKLKAVDAVLLNDNYSAIPPLALYQISEAASMLRISRQTLWRAIRDKQIKTVEIRPGSRRIPESELLRFVGAEK